MHTFCRFCSPPNYLDDFVRSRIINICTLIAANSPFIEWMYLILFRIKSLFRVPIVYFLLYGLLSFMIYTFFIIPIQTGNKLPSTTMNIVFSSLFCLLLLSYNIFTSYWLWRSQNYLIPSIQTIQFILAAMSSIANIIIVCIYIPMIFKKYCTYCTYCSFAETKYHKLKSIHIQSSIIDIEHQNIINNDQDREIKKGYLCNISILLANS
eukprot:157172_1